MFLSTAATFRDSVFQQIGTSIFLGNSPQRRIAPFPDSVVMSNYFALCLLSMCLDDGKPRPVPCFMAACFHISSIEPFLSGVGRVQVQFRGPIIREIATGRAFFLLTQPRSTQYLLQTRGPPDCHHILIAFSQPGLLKTPEPQSFLEAPDNP